MLGDFKITKYIDDGSAVNKGDIIAEIEGPTVLLLKGERTSLNLLQHMSGIATMTAEAVKKVAGRCQTESSGGITLDTLRDYALTGVDFISVGALTHQIKSLDMSLKACE